MARLLLRRHLGRVRPLLAATVSQKQYSNAALQASFACLRGAHVATATPDRSRLFSPQHAYGVPTFQSRLPRAAFCVFSNAAKRAFSTSSPFFSSSSPSADNPSNVPSTPPEKPKVPLSAKIREEIKHYYHGARLLGLETRVSVHYLRRLLRGEKLTRREIRQLRRTTIDMIRLVPFVALILIPFAELALPFLLKIFPNMLPSTFEKQFEREEKKRRLLKLRMELATFLQTTLNEISFSKVGASGGNGASISPTNGSKPSDAQSSSDEKGDPAQEFAAFFKRLRTAGEVPATADVLAVAKRFEDGLTLEKLTRSQIASMCRYMGINAFGTAGFLRFLLLSHMAKIARDDQLIAQEGVDTLTPAELQKACSERGIRTVDVIDHDRLRVELQQWLDLNLVHKLPASLLILSRVLLLNNNNNNNNKKDSSASKNQEILSEKKASILNMQVPGAVTPKLDANPNFANYIAPAMSDIADPNLLPEPTAEALRATLESLPENLINEAQLQLEKSSDAESLEKRIEAIREEEEVIRVEREELAAAEAEAVAANSAAASNILATSPKSFSSTAADASPEFSEKEAAAAVAAAAPVVEGVSAQSVKEIGEAIKVLTETTALNEEREELAQVTSEYPSNSAGDQSGGLVAAHIERLVRRVSQEADEYERVDGSSLKMINLSNGDLVTQADIEQALQFARSRPDSEEVRKLVALLDSDGDGRIALDELLALAKRLEEQEGHGVVVVNEENKESIGSTSSSATSSLRPDGGSTGPVCSSLKILDCTVAVSETADGKISLGGSSKSVSAAAAAAASSSVQLDTFLEKDEKDLAEKQAESKRKD